MTFDPFAGDRNNLPVNDPFGQPAAPASSTASDEYYDLEGLDMRIPEGLHQARVTNVKKQVAKSSGADMLVWEFTLMSPQAAGLTATLFTSLTTQAYWKLKGVLAALGLNPNGFQRSLAINRLCIVQIVHDSYGGQDRDSVQEVLPHPNGAGTMWQPGTGGVDFSKMLKNPPATQEEPPTRPVEASSILEKQADGEAIQEDSPVRGKRGRKGSDTQTEPPWNGEGASATDELGSGEAGSVEP